jgi:hypothetical protein
MVCTAAFHQIPLNFLQCPLLGFRQFLRDAPATGVPARQPMCVQLLAHPVTFRLRPKRGREIEWFKPAT